ncbi:cytochrome P450 family protein [Zopfia rhizophila CBS 207.26]|uniref:Cytochrome P450 family protein n=1 Tax=Zopfia rhizophila CBS 207.26 TaxID=1314779 RepID=A0A6A6E059_9PEZI|nr:cytochrome P450 family protein [Zopfia rhizophila CBS 207.26]
MILLSSTVLLIDVVGVALYSVITCFIKWQHLRHIPGPPLAGWTDPWLLRHVVPGKLCTKLVDVCNKYGPLSIRSGYSRAPWYKATRLNPDEDNVLTMLDTNGHHWLRVLLAPAYAGKGMDNQECLVDQQYLTQDVITAVGFGKAAGYLDADEDMLGVLETCEVLLPVGHIIMFLPKLTDNRGVSGLLGLIKSHVDTCYGASKTRNNDMLQTFVDSGLRRSQVEAEALITMFFLSTNLLAYRKLQAEVDAAVVSAAPPIIADEYAKRLPYLQGCIREGIRLWSPSMALLPKVSESKQVVCGTRVLARTNVGWAGLKIMRDRRVFGVNADVFEPGRWINVEPEKLRQMEGVYGLVFAIGARWECLGKRLAYEELGKVLFELFLRYDFAMVNPIHPFEWINHGFTIHRSMNVSITGREKPGSE